MSSYKSIEKVVERVLREHLQSGEVLRVEIKRNEDIVDSDILSIKVVFNAKKRSLDTSEVSKIARFIWTELIDIGEEGFPSVSFVSNSEARKAAAA